MTNSTPELPWTPGDEFDKAMRVIERKNPYGQANTLIRRLLWWNLSQKARDLYPPLPDDPFDASAWLNPKATQ